MLTACETELDELSRRSISIVKNLTSEPIDIAELARSAGWPEGTDPRMLLDKTGPHVSLVYIRNRGRQGQVHLYHVDKKVILSGGERKSITVQVRKKNTGPAAAIASIELVFNKDKSGKWILAAINTDG